MISLYLPIGRGPAAAHSEQILQEDVFACKVSGDDGNESEIYT